MATSDYPALTVKDLYEKCKEQIDQGNGDKKILISADDEGNGFHGLFYPFTYDQEMIGNYKEAIYDDVNLKDVVLLG